MDSPTLQITGRVESVEPYLSAADISINPVTWGSGSNVKVFESLAAELPVISTKFGLRGLNASLQDSLAVYQSEDELMQTLEKLSTERTQLKEFGRSLLEIHRSNILMDDMVREILIPKLNCPNAELEEVRYE